MLKGVREKMIQPLSKDKWFQGILTPVGRREAKLDRTWISQESSDIRRYPHRLGTLTLSRATAMETPRMGRYNFRATAIIDGYFYCAYLWLSNSSFVIRVETDEFFIIGTSTTLWPTDISP